MHRIQNTQTTFEAHSAALQSASFKEVAMEHAKFEDVNLGASEFTNCTFTSAHFENCDFNGATINNILIEDLLIAYRLLKRQPDRN